MAKLIAIDGPVRGREYTLGEATVFGRRLDTDIRIPHRTVSRHHAKITETGKGFVIVDLNSGNGTFVNGRRIARTTRLKHHDRIQIGTTAFVFCERESADLEGLDRSSVSFFEGEAKSESTVIATIEPPEESEPEPVAPAPDETEAIPTESITAQDRSTKTPAISESMQSVLDLRQLLPEIMNDLFRIFPITDRGLIMLHDHARGELVPMVTRSKAGSGEAKMLVSKTVVSEVQRTRRSILSADTMADKRFGKRESIAALQIRSVMCVPLIRGREFLGLIYVDTSSGAAKFTPDDLHLLTGVASQAALAIQNTRTYDALLKQRRIEQELQFAQDVQKGFLPERVPEIPGFEFSAWYGAALEVGGDFYDFIEMPDGTLVIVIGDVSGKGLPAALMMARLMGEVRFLALSDSDPGSVLVDLNRRIAKHRTAQGRFVTLLYLVLDPASGTVKIANAGHPCPVLRRNSASAVDLLDRSLSVPLGVVADAEYSTQVCPLAPGDTLAIFTDGVTEAMSPNKKPFGAARLQAAVEKSPPSPKAMMEHILSAVSEFVGVASPSDDLTLVCFGRTA